MNITVMSTAYHTITDVSLDRLSAVDNITIPERHGVESFVVQDSPGPTTVCKDGQCRLRSTCGLSATDWEHRGIPSSAATVGVVGAMSTVCPCWGTGGTASPASQSRGCENFNRAVENHRKAPTSLEKQIYSISHRALCYMSLFGDRCTFGSCCLTNS